MGFFQRIIADAQRLKPRPAALAQAANTPGARYIGTGDPDPGLGARQDAEPSGSPGPATGLHSPSQSVFEPGRSSSGGGMTAEAPVAGAKFEVGEVSLPAPGPAPFDARPAEATSVQPARPPAPAMAGATPSAGATSEAIVPEPYLQNLAGQWGRPLPADPGGREEASPPPVSGAPHSIRESSPATWAHPPHRSPEDVPASASAQPEAMPGGAGSGSGPEGPMPGTGSDGPSSTGLSRSSTKPQAGSADRPGSPEVRAYERPRVPAGFVTVDRAEAVARDSTAGRGAPLATGHAAADAPDRPAPAADTRIHPEADRSLGRSQERAAPTPVQSTQPTVHIGRIDVVVESPQPAQQDRRTVTVADDLASRLYLRGL